MVILSSPLLVFLGIVLIYSVSGGAIEPADSIPSRYLAMSILSDFDLDLDEFPFLYRPEIPYFVKKSGVHIVSAYPPGAALVAMPVYLLPVLGGIPHQSHLLSQLGKFAATLTTALSAIVLYMALRRITQANIAWLVALVYAFGTSSFSISGQGLWQHGPSQLFLALTIYCLIRGLEEPGLSAWAGLTLSGAVICRPLNLLVALPIGAYVLRERPRETIRFVLFALPPLLLFIGYNSFYFGSPFTMGFASFVVDPAWMWSNRSSFDAPLLRGLAGVFFSPGRGLFLYSPILLFSLVGMAMIWRAPGNLLLKYLSLAPLPLILLVGKWGMWWGGHSYGPRLLADLSPIFCLYLYLPFERSASKALLRYSLVALSAVSIGLHTLGAFSDGSWDKLPTDIDSHPERLWSLTESPPIYYLERLGRKLGQLYSRPTQEERRQTAALHAFVSKAYQEVLGRAPDSMALGFWVPFIRARCNTNGFGALADSLVESSEFWNSRPLSPAGFSTVLYRAFLWRDPDPAGVAFWTDRVRWARLRLALLAFLPSPEFKRVLPDPSARAAVTEVIARFYTELLGRDPDQLGLDTWINYSLANEDLAAPVVGLLGSAEFHERGLPIQQYVPALHRAFLGRDPGRAEVALWEGRLRADLLSMIREDFIASEEFEGLAKLICGS
jgi:hypothetical protein